MAVPREGKRTVILLLSLSMTITQPWSPLKTS
jgi:hypothetical protein